MAKTGRDKDGQDVRRLHAAALRTARRCRRIIQTCLREEEWRDADEEFCAVILAAMLEREKERR